MNPALLVAFLFVVPGQAPPSDDAAREQAAKARRERLLELYRNDAAEYVIHRDASRKERVVFQPEPVYVWLNPVRGGGQDGAVFVWTCRGRAEVVGTIFSYPSTGPRNLNHELHSLATTVLDVNRSGAQKNTWKPEAPGIDLLPIASAPAPSRSASQRLVQMRALTRDFSAETEDLDGRRWEQRLLPQPLYRYQSTDPDVLDGAVFAFVSSAGTDPEVLLVLEAVRPSGGGEFAWHYALARFTDMKLSVRQNGKEVLSLPLIPYDAPQQDPKHRYRSFRDRSIPPVEEAAR
jgi:hypothetical protein